jgi:hypothetical protein
VLVILSLVPENLLPGGQREQTTRLEVPEGAEAGELFLEPCTYTAIADNVQYDAECGILVVPENRKDENSRLITLPVTRITATGGSTLEPIFWLEGGPGGPNRDYRAELDLPDAIVGAPLSRFLLGFLDGWPVTSDQSSATISDSDVETLLISGTLDGSTPMRYARDELMPHLNNGQHVVLKAQGHTETFWNTQAQARAHLLNTYFNTGVVDDSLYQHESLVFDVNQSWGGMANALLTAFISIFGILILLAVLATRRIRKFYQVKPISGNEPDYRALDYRDT